MKRAHFPMYLTPIEVAERWGCTSANVIDAVRTSHLAAVRFSATGAVDEEFNPDSFGFDQRLDELGDIYALHNGDPMAGEWKCGKIKITLEEVLQHEHKIMPNSATDNAQANAVPDGVESAVAQKTRRSLASVASGNPWEMSHPDDPPSEQNWYTPARYFARELIEHNKSLIDKRGSPSAPGILPKMVGEKLEEKNIYKRGGKLPLKPATILRAFVGVDLDTKNPQ